MFGLPEELLFLLMFGIVWLVQFLRRQRLRQTPPGADAEPDAEADASADEQPGPAPRPPTSLANLAEGPRRAPPPRPRVLAPSPAPRPAHRYSRSALLGNRRAVQDAMVVAAILQPCRAHRPHGKD